MTILIGNVDFTYLSKRNIYPLQYTIEDETFYVNYNKIIEFCMNMYLDDRFMKILEILNVNYDILKEYCEQNEENTLWKYFTQETNIKQDDPIFVTNRVNLITLYNDKYELIHNYRWIDHIRFLMSKKSYKNNTNLLLWDIFCNIVVSKNTVEYIKIIQMKNTHLEEKLDVVFKKIRENLNNENNLFPCIYGCQLPHEIMPLFNENYQLFEKCLDRYNLKFYSGDISGKKRIGFIYHGNVEIKSLIQGNYLNYFKKGISLCENLYEIIYKKIDMLIENDISQSELDFIKKHCLYILKHLFIVNVKYNNIKINVLTFACDYHYDNKYIIDVICDLLSFIMESLEEETVCCCNFNTRLNESSEQIDDKCIKSNELNIFPNSNIEFDFTSSLRKSIFEFEKVDTSLYPLHKIITNSGQYIKTDIYPDVNNKNISLPNPQWPIESCMLTCKFIPDNLCDIEWFIEKYNLQNEKKRIITNPYLYKFDNLLSANLDDIMWPKTNMTRRFPLFSQSDAEKIMDAVLLYNSDGLIT
jgi:hypothetical protein